MLWLKRNLFVAVGGVIAVALLALGGYYLYTSYEKNREVETALDENMRALTNLYNHVPFPHRTNIDMAKREIQAIKDAVTKSHQFFQPLPSRPVKDLAFKTLLDNTIFDLQKQAERSSVILPQKDYNFTFTAEKGMVQFPPGSFPALPQQLAEVKAICEILFEAKVNKINNLRRVRVGTVANPAANDSTDYLKEAIETDPVLGTIHTPYQVEFLSFSGELAAVLEGFSRVKSGLIVKAVMVDSELEPVTAPGQPNPLVATPIPPNPNRTQPFTPINPGRVTNVRTNRTNPRGGGPGTGNPTPRRQPPGGAIAPMGPSGGPGGFRPPVTPKDSLQTVLNEKLIKVTLLIHAVKLP